MANAETNFQVSGDGEPTIVFVHGYDCALEDWAAQVAYLSPKYRCVALDLPGHGSSPLNGRRSMAALTTAINEVKRKSAAGKVVLVGHSLGIRLIMDAYLEEPKDVLGLVLVDARFYDGRPQDVAKRMQAFLEASGFVDFIQRSFSRMFVERSDPELAKRIVQRAGKIDPEFGRELFLESVLSDSVRGRETLQRIKIPVLLLQSSDVDENRVMISLQPNSRTHYMRLVEELIPGSIVKAVPNAGHFTMLDAPDTVNQEIENFVELLAGRSGAPSLSTSA